jgi:ATP-binding cassette, subfamily B, bacterial
MPEPRRRRRRPRAERRLGLVFGMAWQADPVLFVACALTAIGSLAANLMYPIGFGVLVDGAITDHGSRIVIGAAVVTLALPCSYAFQAVGSSLGIKLTDQVSATLGLHIGRLVSSAPFLEHFERPEYLAEIDTLRERHRALAAVPVQSLNLAGSGLLIIGVAVVLAQLWPPLAVVPLFVVAPVVGNRIAARIEKRSDDELAESRRLCGEMFSLVSTPGPAKELRTFGVIGALLDRHACLGEQIDRQELRAARRGAAYKAAGWFLYGLAFVGAIVVLLLRAAHGEVLAGSVVAAIGFMRRAQQHVSRVSVNAGSFATAMTIADRVLWLEDYVDSALADGTGQVPARLHQGIRLEHVDFRYPGQQDLTLDDVDLVLPAGRIIALVGENGAGKSTLVKLLTGMYQPACGRITVDGTDLAAIEPARWRTATTGAFQDFAQFQTTIGEGVGIGDLPRIDDKRAVRRALSRAGAAALADEFPEGLGALLGRWIGGHSLSTGQWQRVALARGLMRQAPLLVVLDEPTASLDPPTEAALFSRYRDVARRLGRANGTITVLVTHRFSSAHMADQIIVMDHGHVTEEGDHAELVRRKGTYAELFTLQMAGYLGS